MSRTLLVITPVKNEEEYLGVTIASLERQTVTPTRWIIVDDASTDRTGAIADAAAARRDWITVIHRQGPKERRVGPGVIEAFYEGLAHDELANYDYVCKLDGDLLLQPGYFEGLFQKFEADPRLGTASGKAYALVDGKFVLERTGDEFSHGVTKLYRTKCFDEIGGFVREVMWDGIDCHRCRMLGWKAKSFSDPELAVGHLRLMGSSHKSVYHGRMRWGRGQWFMGTHPLYLAGITGYRMLERPRVLGGLCILAGYVQAGLARQPRYGDKTFRKHLHRWQFEQLFGRRGNRSSSRLLTSEAPESLLRLAEELVRTVEPASVLR